MINRIKNLFVSKNAHSKIEAIIDPPTQPVSKSSQNEQKIQTVRASRLYIPQLMVGSAQSPGMVRDHNEDSIFTLNSMIMNNGDHLPLGLFVVADGMGGHKQGEIASNLAVRTFTRSVLGRVMLGLFEPHPISPDKSIVEIMEESVLEAHHLIVKEAPGSGTTLTAILVVGRQMTIAHVGDSRAYAIDPNGQGKVLTRDHSLVRRMIELGHLTEEEAAVHPQRNVLYRALGQAEPFTPDVTNAPTPDSGYLMLCSDGLWGVVPEETIFDAIINQPVPELACQSLVDSANLNGGPDNVSVILAKLPALPT